MTIGSASAPITLVEYASVTCRHCAAFQTELLPQIQAKYIATGNVRYVFREYLTPPENISASGFLLARCAGPNHYFQVIDAIMRAQGEMFGDGTTDKALPTLRRIGLSFGIDQARFDRCITDAKGLKRIQAGMAAADAQHPIAGAPAFFINGKPLLRTTGDIRDFDAAFAPLLKK